MGIHQFRSGAAAIAAVLLAAELLSAPCMASAAVGSVLGEVRVLSGRLPRPARVRALPVEGGERFSAPVEKSGHFVFDELPVGVYRFEILLANNSVFAEAGAQENRIDPGVNRLTLLVQRGRTPADRRSHGDWQLWTVIGGLAAVALACEETDCNADGATAVSPSTP